MTAAWLQLLRKVEPSLVLLASSSFFAVVRWFAAAEKHTINPISKNGVYVLQTLLSIVNCTIQSRDQKGITDHSVGQVDESF